MAINEEVEDDVCVEEQESVDSSDSEMFEIPETVVS
jgi:hypothetical protein